MGDREIELIRQFIAGHVNGVPVDDDEDLFGGGYVNSLFAVQLVMWIERTFGVVVDRGDLDIAKFATISAIASFVGQKLTPGAQTEEITEEITEERAIEPVGERSWTSG
jgi:methoxymalonate biosynthesis acyl carrier protein